MITYCAVQDALAVNAPIELDEFPYPLQKFTWNYPNTGEDQPKSHTAGRWDTFKRGDAMLIECEGEIVTNSTAELVAAKKVLVFATIAKQIQTVRKHSKLFVQLDGDGEMYIADVWLANFAMPVEATGAPTVIPFMFNWMCNFGYWKAQSSGLPAYI